MSEKIEWICKCGQRLTAAPARVGMSWKCPKCGAKGVVPGKKQSEPYAHDEAAIQQMIGLPPLVRPPKAPPLEDLADEVEVLPEVEETAAHPRRELPPAWRPKAIILPAARTYDALLGVAKWARRLAWFIRTAGIGAAGLFSILNFIFLYRAHMALPPEEHASAFDVILISAVLSTIAGTAIILVVAFLIGLLLDALAEVLVLLIDIEENTRAAAINQLAE